MYLYVLYETKNKDCYKFRKFDSGGLSKKEKLNVYNFLKVAIKNFAIFSERFLAIVSEWRQVDFFRYRN